MEPSPSRHSKGKGQICLQKENAKTILLKDKPNPLNGLNLGLCYLDPKPCPPGKVYTKNLNYLVLSLIELYYACL